jgi:hypothetical protein
MPQWRKLHVKITESLDVNDMPDDTYRLFWSWLMLGADREGRYLDNPAAVKSKVFPLRTDITYDQIAAMLDWYADHGLIRRYQVGGRHYFYLVNFCPLQGDTGKEADSIYPAPPPPGEEPGQAARKTESTAGQEQVESRPEAGQESGKTQSSTDADADAEIDTDAEAEKTSAAQTPPLALPPPTVADLPPKPPPVNGSKAESPKTAKDDIRAELEAHFARRSGLDPPKAATEKQRRAAGALWYAPLREMAEACDWNLSFALSVMDEALDHVLGDGLTVAAPNSILSNFKAALAARKRGEHWADPPPVRARAPTRKATQHQALESWRRRGTGNGK